MVANTGIALLDCERLDYNLYISVYCSIDYLQVYYSLRNTEKYRSNLYQLNPVCIEKVLLPYGICPISPNMRQLTVPVGRIVR